MTNPEKARQILHEAFSASVTPWLGTLLHQFLADAKNMELPIKDKKNPTVAEFMRFHLPDDEQFKLFVPLLICTSMPDQMPTAQQWNEAADALVKLTQAAEAHGNDLAKADAKVFSFLHDEVSKAMKEMGITHKEAIPGIALIGNNSKEIAQSLLAAPLAKLIPAEHWHDYQKTARLEATATVQSFLNSLMQDGKDGRIRSFQTLINHANNGSALETADIQTMSEYLHDVQTGLQAGLDVAQKKRPPLPDQLHHFTHGAMHINCLLIDAVQLLAKQMGISLPNMPTHNPEAADARSIGRTFFDKKIGDFISNKDALHYLNVGHQSFSGAELSGDSTIKRLFEVRPLPQLTALLGYIYGSEQSPPSAELLATCYRFFEVQIEHCLHPPFPAPDAAIRDFNSGSLEMFKQLQSSISEMAKALGYDIRPTIAMCKARRLLQTQLVDVIPAKYLEQYCDATQTPPDETIHELVTMSIAEKADERVGALQALIDLAYNGKLPSLKHLDDAYNVLLDTSEAMSGVIHPETPQDPDILRNSVGGVPVNLEIMQAIEDIAKTLDITLNTEKPSGTILSEALTHKLRRSAPAADIIAKN